ncbi:hypothetical protein ANCCAN_15640, partial [Ancylostoma caninum]
MYLSSTVRSFFRRTVFNDASRPTCCYTHPPPKQTSPRGILKYLPQDYVFAMGEVYESSRFQCDLCGNSREGLVRCSVCEEDGDPVLAHVTCARQAGFLFERRTFPQITAMVCDRHQASEGKPHRYHFVLFTVLAEFAVSEQI